MERSELPVLFFDSGVGGISILRRSVRLLPCEDYLYFGDSLMRPTACAASARCASSA